MAVTLDTLKIAKRFPEATTDEARAEAFAETFREVHELQTGHLATKQDGALLKQEIGALRQELKGEIAARIGEAQNALLRWTVPLLLGQTALMVGLTELL